MTSPLVVDVRGNELLSFEPGSESDLERVDLTIPLPLALVVGRHGEDILLVFNRVRQEWELPGGMLDPGETPRRAAAREFVEETAQPRPDLTYAGVATFRLLPDRRVEYAAVYKAELPGHAPFEPNDEVERIGWWDGTDIPQLSPLDATIARLTQQTG